ncbi:MAG: spore coat biosynthesis protein F [Thermodesulfobacteriota bacterium]|nr:spore coat biosynthesis protein F [Thermodesulfobacteriota bacterium]
MKTDTKENVRVIASIEARMGSTRLPRKVLADVCGQPSLTRLLRRLRRCQTLDGIILATSSLPQDDPLERWARSENLDIYRGSEEDVLQRVVDAQQSMQSDVVVEITGDCTILDPEIIDMGVTTFLMNDCDVVLSAPEMYPGGMDVLVYRYSILEDNARTQFDPLVREHVAYYIVRHPEIYRTIKLYPPARWQAPHFRFMLDYPEDLEFIRQVYRRLEPDYGDGFGIEEIMSLMRQEPALLDINSHCDRKI